MNELEIRLAQLRDIFEKSGLSSLLRNRKEERNDQRQFVALRFEQNLFRLRSIEIWKRGDTKGGDFFRIYHGKNIASEIKSAINDIPGIFRSSDDKTDIRGDYLETAKNLYGIISNQTFQQIAEEERHFSRNSEYEGLELPDVDTADDQILGRVFTWKELIAISEDISTDNLLKNALGQSGIYLQRSKNGSSRYVGAAYGEGGFLGRWLKHLNHNGNAKHLNLYVLENGYSNMIFTVLEICDPSLVMTKESQWKAALGSKNDGIYDGLRLNCN